MPSSRAATEPAEEPVYDENGVDRSLVRWMLRLTPGERLEVLEDLVELGESAHREQVRRDPQNA